jgi:mannosyltransferase OCH1-like enzyme
MAIPKTIFQTFKTSKLPLLTRWHIKQMKKNNPEYDYQFYDDARISSFIKDEFGDEVYEIYDSILLGAAKADFFRYSILYKKGGVYLDIDSLFLQKLDHFILPDDSAIISLEGNRQFYIQYALFYEAGHPFLKKTLDVIIQNIKENKYPNNTHQMTGPTAYTKGINECLKESKDIKYRQVGLNYDYVVKFSYRMAKTVLYGFSRKNHWKRLSKKYSVLKKDESPE